MMQRPVIDLSLLPKPLLRPKEAYQAMRKLQAKQNRRRFVDIATDVEPVVGGITVYSNALFDEIGMEDLATDPYLQGNLTLEDKGGSTSIHEPTRHLEETPPQLRPVMGGKNVHSDRIVNENGMENAASGTESALKFTLDERERDKKSAYQWKRKRAGAAEEILVTRNQVEQHESCSDISDVPFSYLKTKKTKRCDTETISTTNLSGLKVLSKTRPITFNASNENAFGRDQVTTGTEPAQTKSLSTKQPHTTNLLRAQPCTLPSNVEHTGNLVHHSGPMPYSEEESNSITLRNNDLGMKAQRALTTQLCNQTEFAEEHDLLTRLEEDITIAEERCFGPSGMVIAEMNLAEPIPEHVLDQEREWDQYEAVQAVGCYVRCLKDAARKWSGGKESWMSMLWQLEKAILFRNSKSVLE